MTEETIFLTALEKPTPAARAAFLDEVCGGDDALRERIEALLRSHTDPDSFLDVPALQRQTASGELPTVDPIPPASSASIGGEQALDQPGQETLSRDEALAFLKPSTEPGSLGRLDHYEVLELVGRGGMGVVYRARDTKLQRVVALKLLAPQLAANGPARKRFVREAQATAAVRDDHVVSIHAVHDEGPVPYLVTEFISGQTLAERISRDGPLEVKEVLRVGLQAARGLAAAHAQGLIHRDVTPRNILLENGVQRVKLIDFGLVRAVDLDHTTHSGLIAGTPLYMSPEQARGEPVDPRSDLFSLGSVLYTMCAGRPAFQAGNTMAVLKRVCDDTPHPIRAANPDIPEWLAAIVERLLAKDPADRYQSAQELAELLGWHLASLQQPNLAAPPPPAARPARAAPPTESRPRRPSRTAALLAGLAGVAVCLGVAAYLARASLFPPPDGGNAVTPKPDPGPAPPPTPGVLTVSNKVEDGGQFRTIAEALEKVKPGMTIRVLDDAVYSEVLRIDRPDQFRGVMLESPKGATLQGSAELAGAKEGQASFVVRVWGVADFTLRGLRLARKSAKKQPCVLVDAARQVPGLRLEGLEFLGDANVHGCEISNLALAPGDAPVIVRSCTFRHCKKGVLVSPFQPGVNRAALPQIGNVIIRDCLFANGEEGVVLFGPIRGVLVVGNRLTRMQRAVYVGALLPGARDLVIANNTTRGNEVGFQLYDERVRGENIHLRNNLFLGPHGRVDLAIVEGGEDGVVKGPGDGRLLLASAGWKIGHNWREAGDKPAPQNRPFRIPRAATDHEADEIPLLSREPDHRDFLRPAKDSPLAAGGAGKDSPWLPSYVGAVPPEGEKAWDWGPTWEVLCRRLLTVSQKPEDGGRFRTIKEALDRAEPGTTIRVLDDAGYEEQLLINRPEQHRGVTLEAAGKATIRKLPNRQTAVRIHAVPGVTLRGLRLKSSAGRHALIEVSGSCPGLTLERLDITANKEGDCVNLHDIALKVSDAPILIQDCAIRDGLFGIAIAGRVRQDPDSPLPTGHVRIRNNVLSGLGQGVSLSGVAYRVHIVGNRISDAGLAGIDLIDLLRGTRDILIANNTLFRNRLALRIWDDGAKGKEFLRCENVRIQNNLLLDPPQKVDMLILDHPRGVMKKGRAGDLKSLLASPQWRFSHNWRMIVPTNPGLEHRDCRIPACRHDQIRDSIQILSRQPDHRDFLRPPKDSPLAKGGAGTTEGSAATLASAVGLASAVPDAWLAAWQAADSMSSADAALPPYVGAVPPEGVKPWDWDRTWKALVR